MKRMLTVLSVLAIVNLLGIAGAIGWLVATQRLTTDRVEAVRQLIREPAPVEQARLEAEQKAAQESEAEAEAQRPLPDAPPIRADQMVSLRRDWEEATEFRSQRLDRENDVLAQTTAQVFRKLDKERAAFEAERERFQRQQQAIAALRGDEQFQAALSVLSAVKPAEAKTMLQEIIEERAGAVGVIDHPAMTGLDRAVAYLDELDDLVRGKIMAEFVEDSPTVAAELLERIRTFGMMADASGARAP